MFHNILIPRLEIPDKLTELHPGVEVNGRVHRPLADQNLEEIVRKVCVISNMFSIGDEIVSQSPVLDGINLNFPNAETIFITPQFELYEHVKLPANVRSPDDLVTVSQEYFDLVLCADPFNKAKKHIPRSRFTVNFTPNSLYHRARLALTAHHINLFEGVRRIMTYDNGETVKKVLNSVLPGEEYDFVYNSVSGIVNDLGLRSESPRSRLYLESTAAEVRDGALIRNNIPLSEPYIVINTHGRNNVWKNYLHELTKYPDDSTNVVLLGNGEELVGQDENTKLLVGKSNIYPCSFELNELLPVLASASQVISIDTSIVHMSIALGVPTLGLFQTQHHRWSPKFVTEAEFKGVYDSNLDFSFHQIQPYLKKPLSVRTS